MPTNTPKPETFRPAQNLHLSSFERNFIQLLRGMPVGDRVSLIRHARHCYKKQIEGDLMEYGKIPLPSTWLDLIHQLNPFYLDRKRKSPRSRIGAAERRLFAEHVALKQKTE